jgi:DNA-binding MarR family transcriptional regulator
MTGPDERMTGFGRCSRGIIVPRDRSEPSHGDPCGIRYRDESDFPTLLPSFDPFFDAVLRLSLAEDRCVGLIFTSGGVLIRFPPTRRIADQLGVTHSHILKIIGALVACGLATRAERIEVRTTPAGTRRLFRLIEKRYRAETEVLLGTDTYALLRGPSPMTPLEATALR